MQQSIQGYNCTPAPSRATSSCTPAPPPRLVSHADQPQAHRQAISSARTPHPTPAHPFINKNKPIERGPLVLPPRDEVACWPGSQSPPCLDWVPGLAACPCAWVYCEGCRDAPLGECDLTNAWLQIWNQGQAAGVTMRNALHADASRDNGSHDDGVHR